MAYGLNMVAEEGRLTRDPEIRTVTSGDKTCRFTIAVQRTKERTDFLDAQAWNNTAEIIGRHFKKGDGIAITGALYSDEFTDREGKKRKSTYINVTSVHFPPTRKEAEVPEEVAEAPVIADEEDLPF